MDKKLNIHEKLQKVQCELKAPKSQYNAFAKFNYRNAEDILEAVKPLQEKYGFHTTLDDIDVQIGERYYIKSTAIFTDTADGQTIQVSAYAREAEEKKGMDSSQVTGATSSYARKYALNGLFAIDDTKDADHQDNTAKGQIKPSESKSQHPTDQSNDYVSKNLGL